jgi:hypothetical protein
MDKARCRAEGVFYYYVAEPGLQRSENAVRERFEIVAALQNPDEATGAMRVSDAFQA